MRNPEKERIDKLRSLLLEKRERGLNDLFFFNKYILENDPIRRGYLVPHVHGEWTSWYQNSRKRIKMLLVPRGTFKSTFFTVGRTIQKIVKNRNSRIMLANATADNAGKFLTEIKDHLTKNETLIELYGKFYNPRLRWNETQIDVEGRSLGIKEATITAAGVGGNLVSTHFDTIIADDLVNLENSATRYQADKVIDWWRRAFSLLDPEGEMIIIGTRWSNYELYSYIFDKMKKEVDMYIRGAFNTDGSCYFPELLGKDKLEELKKIEGSYIFSSFYLNDPLDEESSIIRRSQLKYYEDGQQPQNLVLFAMCDPAVSQEIKSDYSTILLVGVDTMGNWWVLKTIREKMTVGEFIGNLFTLYLEHRPVSMTLEVIGQAQGLLSPIHDEEERRKVYLPLVEIKSRGTITKEMRIRSVLQPRFERGQIFIRRDMVELEEEILKFPNARHDDMVDALTDLETIAFPAEATLEKIASTGSFFGDQLQAHPKKKDSGWTDIEDGFEGGPEMEGFDDDVF